MGGYTDRQRPLSEDQQRILVEAGVEDAHRLLYCGYCDCVYAPSEDMEPIRKGDKHLIRGNLDPAGEGIWTPMSAAQRWRL